VSPSIILMTRPRITFFSLKYDKGMSLAVLYCRNGIGNTAAVVAEDEEDDDGDNIMALEEEGRVLLSASCCGDESSSTTPLLLNNIDVAKVNDRKLFWNRTGKSIAGVSYKSGDFF